MVQARGCMYFVGVVWTAACVGTDHGCDTSDLTPAASMARVRHVDEGPGHKTGKRGPGCETSWMTGEWRGHDEMQEGQRQRGQVPGWQDTAWDGLQPMGCTLEHDMD